MLANYVPAKWASSGQEEKPFLTFALWSSPYRSRPPIDNKIAWISQKYRGYNDIIVVQRICVAMNLSEENPERKINCMKHLITMQISVDINIDSNVSFNHINTFNIIFFLVRAI